MFICASANAASFDCAKARSKIEKLICADSDLSNLDQDLGEIYSMDLARDIDAVNLKTSQRTWLAKRDLCADSMCVKQAYEDRLAQLYCDEKSNLRGSAQGALQCSYFSLQLLERELTPLEEKYGKKLAADTNNPEYTATTFKREAKAWRDYRDAQCALYGATEGGLDKWKSAFAVGCAWTETKNRVDKLKQDLAKL
jgi:uncharacterized protein